MNNQSRTSTAARELGTITQALRQELQRASHKESRVLIQTALQSIVAASTREETAMNVVTQAWDKVAERDEQDDLQSLLQGVDGACGAAIKELYLVAVLWQRIGEDLLACGESLARSLRYQCLLQRGRVTQLAQEVMSQQLEALQRLNQDTTAQQSVLHDDEAQPGERGASQ